MVKEKRALQACLILIATAAAFSSAAAQGNDALNWRIPELAPPDPMRAQDFAARRRALADSMADGVLVVLGARSPAQDYLPYQQNPAFRFLTGVEEPDAALIIQKKGGQVQERLFVQPRNPSREVWEGARLGPEGAREQTGMQAEPNNRLTTVLDSLLAQTPMLYATIGAPNAPDADEEQSYEQQVVSRVAAKNSSVQVKSVGGWLRTLRAKKSQAELDRIRRATYITAEAHRQAMQATEPGMNEFEIRALVEYVFLRNGGDGPSYASIVGSGANSTTLHYNADDRCMNDGEVLLFDVAAYFGGYASDVTRTIPINGKFTPEQRDVYEIVLAAQKAAEKQIKQGAYWQDLNNAANAELGKGLAKLGLIDKPDAQYDCGTPTNARKCQQVRLFYMHGLGHGVGLEVHDPDISNMGGFQPGSAVTIEPGIYVRADVFDYLPDTPDNRAMIERLRPALKKYANTGVRIEDVYIFDQNGVERASRGAPREMDEIEALMTQTAPAAAGRRQDVVEWRCPRVKT